MTTRLKSDVDVAIIGGGPAGSATAAYLARAGMRCTVLEKARFPRPHVGESLVPATTRVFKELGFLDTMEAAGFIHKHGAAWTSSTSPRVYSHTFEGLGEDYEIDLRFANNPIDGVEQNYSYHVDRAQFDLLLLEHAEALGATVWQETAVTAVDFSTEPFVTVSYQRDGRARRLTAQMVVDASGRRTFLGDRLQLKVKDPVFDQYALHTWFEGFDRGTTDRRNFVVVHFLPITNTWMWQIPITETVTSFGVVTHRDHFARAKTSREAFFWDCVKSRPELYEKLRTARQLEPLKAEGDYSYAMTQCCGDRFVLVGDAMRFVDPIFSSGISIALNSARMASRDILTAMETGSFDRASFAEYERLTQRGCATWYAFISLYYRLNVLFTFFVTDPRYHRDVSRLLQGDVYDEDDPAVLQEMRRIVEEVEQSPGHVWHPLLGSLTVHAFQPPGERTDAEAPTVA